MHDGAPSVPGRLLRTSADGTLVEMLTNLGRVLPVGCRPDL